MYELGSNTYLAAGNHGVNEIWSNQHRKWILSDAEFDGHFEKGGVPLSALEIRDEYLRNEAREVDLVVGPGREKVKPRLLFSPHCYRFVAYELAGDRHTQSGWSSGALAVWEDDYFKTHTWHRWESPDGGKAREHWALRQNFFLRVARREWIEWTPNVTSVTAAVQGDVARVRLRSHTPKLAGTHIEREFRSVNAAGVAGPVSRLLIEQQ